MKYLFISLILLSSISISAQNKLRVYLECNQPWLCDPTYMRSELKAIDFVRDRFVSDVQVLANTNFTNGGGESQTLNIIGQQDYAGIADTMTYFNEATATEDIKRQRMIKHLSVALLPYLVKKGDIGNISVEIAYSDTIASGVVQRDIWNQWQFTVGASGYFNGDNNYSSTNAGMNISASREKEKSSFSFYANHGISRDKYTFFGTTSEGEPDTTIIRARKDRQRISANYSVLLNEHWAIGPQAYYGRSIVDNIDMRTFAMARVEYSVLPYKAFNNKRIVFEYDFGPEFYRYADTTIYLKTQELLLRHTIGMTTSFTQKWGSLNLGAYFDQYLHDLSKNSLFVGGGLSWNIVKGLKFSIGGNVEFQRNQISIPKQTVSIEDLLTQRRIIASSYSFWGGVGFSYTFGSIFNSQVHPAYRGLNYNLNF